MYIRGTPNFYTLKSEEKRIKHQKSKRIDYSEEEDLFRMKGYPRNKRGSPLKPRPDPFKKNTQLSSFMKVTKHIRHAKKFDYDKENASFSYPYKTPLLKKEDQSISFFTAHKLQTSSYVNPLIGDDFFREQLISLNLEKRQYDKMQPYMMKQNDITEHMRRVLLDWIIEVHNKLKLKPRILYLTQYLIDRYLAVTNVVRNELQLIAVTSMYIALKCEENVGITASVIVGIADGAFSLEQMKEMEINLLNELNFPIMDPNIFDFLNIWRTQFPLNPEQVNLAYFFADCTILNYHLCVTELPSHIAAAAIRLAIKLTSQAAADDDDGDISEVTLPLPLRKTNERAIQDIATALLKDAKSIKKAHQGALFKKYPKILSSYF